MPYEISTSTTLNAGGNLPPSQRIYNRTHRPIDRYFKGENSQIDFDAEKLYQLYGPMTLDNPIWMEWVMK